MDNSLERLQRYSWHQSHDQATVLLLVPYETIPEDILVVIEQNYLVAGVRGHPAIVKGRLYSAVDTTNSAWQLEPRASLRERTISSTSSHSSFAVVSEPDISSSFAASLESGRDSETDDYNDFAHSPVLSSPSSNDEHAGIIPRHRDDFVMPQIFGVSSPRGRPSLVSSFSSTESLHSARSGRLLTLHLEKAESIIWPSLVVGPVPSRLSPTIYLPENLQDSELPVNEDDFNMDPTSLSLVAVDMLDIRQERIEAFEHLLRAWYQSRTPISTLKLVTNYIPLHVPILLPPAPTDSIAKGTPSYYAKRVGGASGLAQLYVEAGLLHVEGAASLLMSSPSTALSSLRSSDPYHAFALREIGTEGWRRDRDAARRYFERAKALDPSIEIPILPAGSDESGNGRDRRSTSVVDVRSTPTSASVVSRASSRREAQKSVDAIAKHKKRRREREEHKESILERSTQAVDDLWYLYVPGVVGAVIAVGVVGALSLTSWRKSQS